MGAVSEIVVPLPPDLTPATGGAATQGQAYTLTMPAVATDAMTVTSADGRTFTARPTELVYSGKDAAGVRAYDYYVGSAPSTVTTNGRQARYGRVFPKADDVYVAQREGVKHYTVMQAAPRLPADYLVSDVEFGVSSLIGGVPLVPGRHEHIEAWGFALPRPFATDLAGAKVYGEYEVVDSDVGQQLFVWFPAAWFADAERVYPVTIDPTVTTSTSQNGATSGQHHIGAFANGVQFAGIAVGSDLICRVSSDGGLSWVVPTAGATIVTNNPDFQRFSLKIVDDYVNIMGGGPSFFNYLSGSPTGAARTGFTWGTPLQVCSNTGARAGNPDFNGELVVHSDGAGGWKAHCFGSLSSAVPGSEVQKVQYSRVAITSARAASIEGFVDQLAYRTDTTNYAMTPDAFVDAAKTLHVVFLQNGVGVGQLLYRQAPTGTWTWGTVESITTAMTSSTSVFSLITDNANNPIAAVRQSDNAAHVYKRTATNTWTQLTGVPAFTPTALGLAINRATGDLFLCFTSATQGVCYVKWTSGSSTWGAVVVVDADTTATQLTITQEPVKSIYALTYMTGTASPYTRKSARLLLNVAPQEPTITLGNASFAASVGTNITIDHHDTDQMGAWALKRVNGTVTVWWNNTTKAFDKTAEYFNAGSGTSVTIPAADNAGDWTTENIYQLYAATKDSFSAVGPYNATAVRANVGATPVVTITSAATSNSASYLAEWTCDRAQGAYQVRVLDGATPVWTSGKVSDTSARALSVDVPVNAKVYTIEVTVWDQTTGGGVSSAPATKGVATSFTVPPAPTATASANSAGGFIGVSWTNPAGGTALSYNDLYRREASGAFVRIATQLPAGGTYPDYAVTSGVAYEYKVTAVGTNATMSDSNVASAGITLTSGVFLHDPLDPVGTAHLFEYREVNLGDSRKTVSGEFQFVGRAAPVVRFDAGMLQRAVKLRISYLKGTSDLTSLEGFLYNRNTLCLRDFRGRKLFAVLKDLPTTDERWGGTADCEFTVVSFEEAV